MTPSGLLDAPTWNALLPLAPLATLLPIDPAPAGPPIARAQSALNRVGGGPALPVTGVLDAATAAALSAFQTARFLPPTGGLDPSTWLALADADNAQQPETLLRLVFSYTSEDFGNDPFASSCSRRCSTRFRRWSRTCSRLASTAATGSSCTTPWATRSIASFCRTSSPFARKRWRAISRRAEAADPRGTFELVVPVLPRAVLLVLFGPPLAAADHEGPSGAILTFDLTTI